MGIGALQPGHLIVVLVIVLLIFGPGKLPERPKWIRTRSLAMLSEMSGLPEAVGGW